MSKLDIGILILIGLAGLSCYRIGFTQSVWGIVSLGAGFCSANLFWRELVFYVQRLVDNPQVAKWLSIIVLIILTAILTELLFRQLQRIFETGVLGWLNRLFGLGFGIISSAILIAYALILLNMYATDSFRNEIANSTLAPQLMDIGRRLWNDIIDKNAAMYALNLYIP